MKERLTLLYFFQVFDFPEEKYLVTEYVRGGDLFDAIAADTKYTEEVSQGKKPAKHLHIEIQTSLGFTHGQV